MTEAKLLPEDALEKVTELLRKLIEESVRYSRWDDSLTKVFRETREQVSALWADLSGELKMDTRVRDLRDMIVNARADIGDSLFYEKGSPDDAIVEFEFVLSLDPDCTKALEGIIAAYLQGNESYPREALPYALWLSRLNPVHQKTVDYCRSLIAKRFGEEAAKRRYSQDPEIFKLEIICDNLERRCDDTERVLQANPTPENERLLGSLQQQLSETAAEKMMKKFDKKKPEDT